MGHEAELLGAGEDEVAHASPAVHQALEVGDQVGDALYLVDDGAVREAGEESPRIGLRLLALVRVFQGDVGAIGEDGPGEGRLALLAGSRDREDGKPKRQAQRGLFGIAGYHAAHLTN